MSSNESVGMRVTLFVLLLAVIVLTLVLVWERIPVPKKTETPPVNVPVVVAPTSTEPVAPTSTEPVAPTAGMACDTTHSICATQSLMNAVFTNPMTVTGTAVAFENQFSWELYVGISTIPSAFGSAHADASDIGQPGPYAIRIFLLTIPKEATGKIRLFEPSAKDGSPIHVLEIPIRFSQATTALTVFKIVANGGVSCTEVVPVSVTVPRTMLPIETSLRALLDAGVWENRPMDTWIPEKTQLVSLVVSHGVATATFSPDLDQTVAGSCRVSAIRAQIEATLKQFPSVKSVVIMTEGKSAAETLQP